MNKINLIFKREYLAKIRNKTFILMTILGPIFFIGFYAAIILIAINDSKDNEERIVAVKLAEGLPNINIDTVSNITFIKAPNDRMDAVAMVSDEKVFGLLELSIDSTGNMKAGLLTQKTAPAPLLSKLEKFLNRTITKQNFTNAGISPVLVDSLQSKLDIKTTILSDRGETDSVMEVKSGIGIAMAILLYLFIFMYGVQVMKSVTEEKANRIVEVLVSSVKPFQLMIGKILGVAAIGLTQIGIWILLGATAVVVSGLFLNTEINTATVNANTVSGVTGNSLYTTLSNIPWITLAVGFLYFFIFGYLLFSALFAAIAGAIDQETDSQQFIFPVTMPLLFSFVVVQTTLFQNPESELIYWLSFIPFTSPIAMCARLPFGVPIEELIVSMVLLFLTFILVTKIAGKIYRTGILLYGKKITYKELLKWLWYKS